jgi:hypothetical protein
LIFFELSPFQSLHEVKSNARARAPHRRANSRKALPTMPLEGALKMRASTESNERRECGKRNYNAGLARIARGNCDASYGIYANTLG